MYYLYVSVCNIHNKRDVVQPVSDYNYCTYCTVVRTMRKKCVSDSTDVYRCDRDRTCGSVKMTALLGATGTALLGATGTALLGATRTGRKKLLDKRRKNSNDGVCVCVRADQSRQMHN
jgi:hypothetical protein